MDGLRGLVPCPMLGPNNPSSPWTALDTQGCWLGGRLSHCWWVLTCHLPSPQQVTTDINSENPAFLQSVDAQTAMKQCGCRGMLPRFFSCDLHVWAGWACPRAPAASGGHASRTCSATRATRPPKSLFSPKIEVPGYLGNKYHLLSPQPRAAHTLRIRAADTRVLQWGAWSQPVTFGRCPETVRGDPRGPASVPSHSRTVRSLSFCTLPP